MSEYEDYHIPDDGWAEQQAEEEIGRLEDEVKRVEGILASFFSHIIKAGSYNFNPEFFDCNIIAIGKYVNCIIDDSLFIAGVTVQDNFAGFIGTIEITEYSSCQVVIEGNKSELDGSFVDVNKIPIQSSQFENITFDPYPKITASKFLEIFKELKPIDQEIKNDDGRSTDKV